MSRSQRCAQRAGVLTAAVLILAGCGAAGGHATGPPAGSTASTAASTVGTGMTGLGSVLVDSHGRTLYVLTADRAGHQACTGACQTVWPPLAASGGAPTAGAGVSAQLGMLTGGNQVTVNGAPVYLYAGDTAGQARGQGIVSFGGTWYALGPSGAPIKTPAASPSASSAAGGGGGGYGY